jgi:uncharacterized protein YecE (DUF72 family)
MDFGKLPSLDNIDISLPADHEDTKRVLAEATKQKTKTYIGCPVWADKGFVGKLYPKGTKETDFLNEYGKQFNAIELNATHYRIPSLTQIAKWKADVPNTFKFFPKVPQLISHAGNINTKEDLLQIFNSAIWEMKENLGAVFLQLPPYFKPNRFKELEEFVARYPKEIPLFVELRNEAWFQHKNITTEVFNMLESYGTGSVITDVAGRRDVLHNRLTLPKAFIRFTGNDLHPTDFTRLNEWLKRIEQWQQMGLQELYFFLHTPEKHLTAELANYYIEHYNQFSLEKIPAIKLYTTETAEPIKIVGNTLFD